MLATGTSSTVPASVAGSSCAAIRWMMAVPMISSPWIAALTNMTGPGFAPCSARTASVELYPVAIVVTGTAISRMEPGASSCPQISKLAGVSVVGVWVMRRALSALRKRGSRALA